MRIRAKTWKNIVGFTICATGLACAVPGLAQLPKPTPPGAPAPIGAASDAVAAQALDLLNAGKLDEAFAAYTSLIQRFPNSGDVPEAYFRMGYIQYVQKKYPEAIATLSKIKAPPALPEIKAAADALIPQVLSAKADALSPDDPARKAAFKAVIDQYDAFINANPKSPEVEQANYGKAVAAYKSGDFDTAVGCLMDNLKKFQSSEMILDTEDLLAVTLTAQASTILQDKGDRQAAMDKFSLALQHLSRIIQIHKDVALANDAQFQAGEVLFNRGNNEEEGAARTKDLTSAIAVYRLVQPKDLMVQAQGELMAQLQERRRQAVLSRIPGAADAVQRIMDRENAKLDALKNAADETMRAQLRIASCYFLLGQYDEARTMLRFLQPFATEDMEKKQVDYYILLSYASQGLTDKAQAAYEAFQAKYKGDPLGESLPLAMGAAYLKAGQPDKAIKFFQEEITLYPKSPLVNAALGQQAAALIGLKRYPEALDTYQKFLATNPPKDQAAQAGIGIANIYQTTGKMPDAIKQYQKVATDLSTARKRRSRPAFTPRCSRSPWTRRRSLPMLQAYVKKYPGWQVLRPGDDGGRPGPGHGRRYRGGVADLQGCRR